MSLIELTLVTFAISLLITKSKILASKREFVTKRYDASKVNGQQPGRMHIWWHAMWTCAMCNGFWIALVISLFSGFNLISVICAFGLNWLLHCLENILFYAGKGAEKFFQEFD